MKQKERRNRTRVRITEKMETGKKEKKNYRLSHRRVEKKKTRIEKQRVK